MKTDKSNKEQDDVFDERYLQEGNYLLRITVMGFVFCCCSLLSVKWFLMEVGIPLTPEGREIFYKTAKYAWVGLFFFLFCFFKNYLKKNKKVFLSRFVRFLALWCSKKRFAAAYTAVLRRTNTTALSNAKRAGRVLDVYNRYKQRELFLLKFIKCFFAIVVISIVLAWLLS